MNNKDIEKLRLSVINDEKLTEEQKDQLKNFDFSKDIDFAKLNDNDKDIVLKYLNETDKMKIFYIYMMCSKKLFEWKKSDFFKFEEMKIAIDNYYSIVLQYDPDSGSKMLQEIYKKLWNVVDLKNCIKICGETMNSANTTINKFYDYLYGKEDDKYRKRTFGEEQKISFMYLTFKYFTDKEKFDVFNEYKADEFVNTYHNLGNFIPCPVGCNGPRGFNNSIIADYWDLTLACIYNYYIIKNNDDKSKIILSNRINTPYSIFDIVHDKTLEKRYMQWLDTFNTWDEFVKDNYMDSFVDVKGNNQYGKPKELWGNHFKGNAYPQNSDEFKQFFENAKKFIDDRSELMVKELIKK